MYHNCVVAMLINGRPKTEKNTYGTTLKARIHCDWVILKFMCVWDDY